ncbi:MAG: DNA polymerase III subunit delta' [Burkholderiales bacterium]|jgi:DNA polymerase-3 subunit delta'
MEALTYPWVLPLLAKLPTSAMALPRALLLTGRPGLGKRATALFLAQSLLCETKRDGLIPCGTCPSCLLYRAGNHPDLRTLEVGEDETPNAGASDEELLPAKKQSQHIPVQKVRALLDFVTLTPHRGGAKVICIVPVEAMLPAAANALLKILEEPPGDTYFLLVSHQPERLLATIRSRCFHMAFGLPDRQPALAWLEEQGIGNAKLALAQGGYAPLAAIHRAGDPQFWNQRKILLNAVGSDSFDALHVAEEAQDIDGALVATLLAQWVYDIVAIQSGASVRYHLDYAATLQKLARSVSIYELMKWYDAIVRYGRMAEHPLNKRLAMEDVLAGFPGQ